MKRWKKVVEGDVVIVNEEVGVVFGWCRGVMGKLVGLVWGMRVKGF